jgi:subtilisin family serine protease
MLMDPLDQIKLHSLMSISTGSPKIVIGVIDGPVDLNHHAFQGSNIKTIKDSDLAACKRASSIACIHGTFVTGMLTGKRGLSAPAICPSCEIILRPIFSDEIIDINNNNNNNNVTINNIGFPTSTPEELSNAIIETIDAGARIINLSIGLSSSSVIVYSKLSEAYDYALLHGVIIVIAAGNQGNIGSTSLLNHRWIIPVTSCDEHGRLTVDSNFGPTIAKQGLLAPGINITSTSPNGKYIQMGGTSFATPFVTGTIALLWSIFPKATAADIVYSIIKGASHSRTSTIIPPLLNAKQALKVLESMVQ